MQGSTLGGPLRLDALCHPALGTALPVASKSAFTLPLLSPFQPPLVALDSKNADIVIPKHGLRTPTRRVVVSTALGRSARVIKEHQRGKGTEHHNRQLCQLAPDRHGPVAI